MFFGNNHIRGAAGLEAAIHKKPSIIFSDFSYSILPSVYTSYNLLMNYPLPLDHHYATKVNPSDVAKYLEFT